MKQLVDGLARIRITMSKLSKSAFALRAQINAKFPKRDKSSDGWIGDVRHQAKPSDHNPDAQGWVRAIDVDADLTPKYKDQSWDLADELRTLAKSGEKRISYIIHLGKIASPRRNWKWRKYSGNPHTHHIHISFTKLGDENTTPFDLRNLDKKVKPQTKEKK
jgi:hypothetical protein